MNSANSQRHRSKPSRQVAHSPVILKTKDNRAAKDSKSESRPQPSSPGLPLPLNNSRSTSAPSPVKRPTPIQLKRTRQGHGGFSLSETVIAAAAGAVLITGGAIALRTISSSMQHSGDLNSLRTSATSGMRLLRSEVQRSLYLVVGGGSHDSERDYTDLNDPNHPEYAASISECKALAGGAVFNPMFGLKMAELNTPVIYGLGLSQNGNTYALIRCGAPLNTDGHYETEQPTLAPILENIGKIPCTKPAGSSCAAPKNSQGKEMTLAEIAAAVDTTLSVNPANEDLDNRSKPATYLQPAIAIKTDKIRKLLKLVDPTDSSDAISFSFLEIPGGTSDAMVDLDMIAYARADKVARTDAYYSVMNGDTASASEPTTLSGCTGSSCSFYGIPVTNNAIALIVDGSGSMSSCITWGSTYNSTTRVYYNGSSYISTKRNCLVTRMESLQNELRNLLMSLPSTVNISIQAFSSPGYLNHRVWMNGDLVPLADTNRTSALAFVNSLSSGDVTRWGGTSPWSTLDKAFANSNTKSIYFMTDGDPNNDRNGGSWSSFDFQPTANTYLGMNNSRSIKLVANTVSIGQDSPWLKLISDGASGTYKVVNQAYTTVN
ncbi:MAG: hypothetical protein RLZZ263_1073 [Cyanobacteriota bacterium]